MPKQEKKKIGFFGGSYDPIHLGHLNMAIQMKEKHRLDEIWFCPARISPHKLEANPVPIKDRQRMVELAVEGFPTSRVLDIESHREGPSYTFDTLTRIEGNTLFLILSGETAQGFHSWHKSDEIIHMASLLVGSRSCNPLSFDNMKGSPEILNALRKGWTKTSVMEISSTEIRKRLNKRQYCGHLVPEKVLDYIYTNNLYLTS